MREETFQSRYCRSRGVPPDRFRADLLARSLYPHARPFVALLRWADPDYFQPDLAFVDDVGHLTELNGFHEALDDFVSHYSNRRLLRHRFRLRISVRRMWRITRQILPGSMPSGLEKRMEAAGSVTPFDRRTPDRPA